jgi:dihydropyrimidinase
MNILLRGGSLASPEAITPKDLLVEGTTISRVAASIEPDELPAHIRASLRVIDCKGLLILPGFIDAHTHFGLGEGEYRTADGFFEGSVAAALGGVTTFIDFADQIPGHTLREGCQKRIDEAEDSVIDFSLHQGIYRFHDRIDAELDELVSSGVRVLKLFTTYKKFGVRLDPAAWDPLFALCAQKAVLVAAHAEDDDIIENIESNWNDGFSPPSHPRLRPARAEASAIEKLGQSALRHRLPLYIVHVSSLEALMTIRSLRRLGLACVAETAPHYLVLTESSLEGEDGALALMTPPLRSLADGLALQEGLGNGEIQILATDHCSYTPEQKKSKSDCREIPAGIPGTGEASKIVFTILKGTIEAKAMALCRIFSHNPAQAFGLYPQKGSLMPGSDADIVLFDPECSGKISKKTIATASGYSPFEGFEYHGSPIATISKGRLIVEGGLFKGEKGAGRFLPCGLPEPFSASLV